MNLLDSALRNEGLSPADQDELAFHLAEILADLYLLLPLLTRGVPPSPAVVRELIFQVIWHWPYHQKLAAKLERRMKQSVVGR